MTSTKTKTKTKTIFNTKTTLMCRMSSRSILPQADFRSYIAAIDQESILHILYFIA